MRPYILILLAALCAMGINSFAAPKAAAVPDRWQVQTEQIRKDPRFQPDTIWLSVGSNERRVPEIPSGWLENQGPGILYFGQIRVMTYKSRGREYEHRCRAGAYWQRGDGAPGGARLVLFWSGPTTPPGFYSDGSRAVETLGTMDPRIAAAAWQHNTDR
jgi:hypothetical protein